METLLPSEIARLVLGYLEDQKCIEAGKIFLETSPHLQECRTVVSKGRRFSTRVGGMTLIDVIEKFVAITSAIQERLSKIADCEQLRHCGDTLEQLKFLVEETRSQRFVVNINVPSQANAQINNGSPIISSNIRKRRHSNSDRERCKRLKIISNSFPQSEFPASTATGPNDVEATPLESLPGHGETSCRSNYDACAKEEDHNTCQQKHRERGGDQDDRIGETDAVDDNTTTSKDDYTRNFCPFEKCSAATSTEELLSYTCAEVQTNLYDTPESESETNDEPIENLSLLTKELLNRTELQERIAENINKAILPTDTSAKDDTLNDSVNTEANSSIMIELTNAIKSIVEATEADPIFEKFLDEIIGPHVETDTSPDEDMEIKPKVKLLSDSREKQPEANTMEHGTTSIEEKSSNETEGVVEVPLKHRLRSSSRQQNVRVEDEQRDQEKEYNALEDQNAAAIMSIINITGSVPSNDKRISDSVKDVVHLENESEKKFPVFERSPNKDKLVDVRLTSVNNEKDCDSGNSKGNGNGAIIQCNDVESKMRKSSVKRPRVGKPKNETVLNNGTNGHNLEQDIMTMPMLIVCSKQETNDIIAANAGISSVPNSRFIPIMPNDSTAKNGKDFVETLYLKTVNVAQKVPAPVPMTLNEPKKLIVCANAALQARPKGFIKTNCTSKSAASSIASIDVPSTTSNNVDIAVINKFPSEESITLYGSERSAKTLLDSSTLPTINVEDGISLSGAELSPYIKFSCNKSQQNQSLSDIDLTPVDQNVQIVDATHKIVVVDDQQPSTSTSASPSKTAEHNVIDKRTPRSLLRRRSKNHRLSLSTPRRRSSHVRALDFNTPSKMVIPSNKLIGQNQNQDENENARPSSRPGATKHLKPVRRTSLFRSPPFSSHVTRTTHRLKSPLKHRRSSSKPPTATRSPESKLSGGWDKCNGVGVIIESKEDASKENATAIACSGTETKPQPETSKPRRKESWDADLRKALQITADEECQKTQKPSKIPRLPKTKRIESAKKKTVTSRKDRRKRKDAVQILKETSQSSGTVLVSLMENNNNTGDNVVGKSEIGALKLVGGSDGNCNREPNHNNSSDKPVHKRTEEPPKTAPVEQKTVKKCNADKKKQNSTRSNATTTSLDALQQCSELAKISVDIAQQMLQQQIPNLIALETPIKFQNSELPPTPRLLSPSSNATPFPKGNEEISNIRCFISTPEFPTTPGITLTPKLSNEGAIADDAKKDAFHNCSPYYKPTSEQDECSDKPLRMLKRGKNVENSSTLVSQVSMQAVSSPHDIKKPTNTFQTCVSAKLEITQFEVIKGNPPKEEAAEELKISRADSPTRYAKFKSDCAKDNVADADVVSHDNNDNENDATSVASCSSCSSSSSSSSSSFSSSSSSSSSSSPSTFLPASSLSPAFITNQPKDTISPDKSSTSKKCNKPSQTQQPEGSVTLTSQNDLSKLKIKITAAPCTSHTKQATVALRKNESSPTKVFSIFKSDQDLKISTKETPAKDELLLDEADISETPSSSKAGVEHLTNLTSKISAFISSEKSSQSNQDVAAETVPTCKNVSAVPATSAESTVPSAESTAPSTASSEFRCKNNREDPDLDVLVPNSVEYHFLHDDNAPVKKRRRRYSSQELEVQINMNNQGVKAMTATQYEEIFNLPPKWRKRSGNRKSPVKTETCPILVHELFDKPPITLTTIAITHGKPLATSSPLDKTPTPKVKKLSVKTVHATNELNHDRLPDQPNNRKKTKFDKTRESDDNSTAKILRRKLPESRENKQIDKRQYTTDPQTLLSNVDLEKFLTSVHGPA